ncbi:MAG TPA: hypothetical protein VFV72_01800, partial [Candidatus Limnocylindrales bacterium]|nr:hypothetical protein [Candidatus Limnocylindrales bacterium]
GGSKGDVDDLVDERILRVASPQVRLDPDVAVSMAKPADADAIRADYLDHFTDWARSADASDIAAESQAILYLLSWAARAGRYANARALHAATESAFAVTGRWGAWGRATQIAFEASARLGDEAAVATALNQLAIQALGVDADEKARDLLRQAQHRATDAGATFEAAVAARNLRVIDGLPPGPPIERDRGDGGGGPENGGGRIPWPRVAGVGVIALLVAGLLFVLLRPMPALGIEPAAHAFGSTAIENDSEHVSFTVTNSGGTTLEALRVALADEDEGFRVVGGDCQGRTLPSGASCVVEVVFHPGGSGEGATRLIVTASNGVSISAAIAGSAPEPTPPPPTSPPPTTPTPTPPESPTPTPSETPLPDLAIRRFTPNGIPDRAELWRVPVLVEIVNGGPGPADPFEIAITADGKPIPFVVRDEDPERLVTHEPLAAGGSLTYEGNLLLSSDTSLADVRLVVEADSCAGESSPPADCRVAEVNANQANNSLELQAVDLQLSNVVLSEWRNHEEPPDGDVDVSLDVTNGGNIDAGPFSIGVSVKGVLYPFVVGEGAADPASMLYEVDGLASGDTIHVDGIVTIPYDVLYGPLDIDVGCLAGSGQCLLPEIEHANNSDSQLIPQPVVD